MASNTAYRPVGIEEDMRHNSSPNRRRYHDYNDNDDGGGGGGEMRNQNSRPRGNYNRNHIDYDIGNSNNKGSLSSRPSPRHRINENENPEAEDEVDGGFLGFPRRQARGMVGVCCFALILLVIGVVFLLGVCLGFYVRESQQNNVDLDELCTAPEKPSVDYGVLGGYHETLMYYIRGEEIRKFVDEFGTNDPFTGSSLERRMEAAVLEEFNASKMDTVQVEEHDLLVTYPDPDKPNRLQVLHASNGSVLQTFVFAGTPLSVKNIGETAATTTTPSPGSDVNSTVWESEEEDSDDGGDGSDGAKGDNNEYVEMFWRHPHISFSPPGTTKAPLVRCHYGLPSDFDILETLGVSVSGKTVLISLGKTSVADKVMEAERRGAVSVLLYWEVGDHLLETGSHIDPEHVPYASATTYIEDQPSLWTPSIPCQTISTEQAQSLILLLGSVDQDPATTDDGDDVADSDSKSKGLKESILVELHVNHKYRTQQIRNIITTIMGTEEQDHFTIVGASRSALPSSRSQDTVVSTSVLSQLARSIHYLHKLHLWRPRRGIKIVSWAGAEFSNAGVLMHIMKRQHILASRAIAYIDLSHLVSGNETIAAQASSSLHQLLREVAFDIRDPRDEGETIQSRWLHHSGKGNSGTMYSPVSGFGTDNTLYPFLHMFGIPTVRAQFQGRFDGPQIDMTTLQSYSYAHHYKFHIAMCRILVMTLLNLADVELLPINLETVASQFESTVWQTSAVFEDCTDGDTTLEHVVLLGERLKETTKAFEELARGYERRNDTKGMDMVNNMKMQMDRLFVTRQHGTSHHVLYPTNPHGSLQHADHLCQLYSVSYVLAPLLEFGGVLKRIVEEADLLLKVGA